MLKEADDMHSIYVRQVEVLILILMEHAQRGFRRYTKLVHCKRVLILILMEHAQRESKSFNVRDWFGSVLILILMEHAQRG